MAFLILIIREREISHLDSLKTQRHASHVAELAGASSQTPKARRLNSWSEHTSKLCGLIPGQSRFGRQPTDVSLSHQCIIKLIMFMKNI